MKRLTVAFLLALALMSMSVTVFAEHGSIVPWTTSTRLRISR